MANQVNDAAIRAQLHTDILAAWTGDNAPNKIIDNRPRLPQGEADLPYALLRLSEFRQEPSGLRCYEQTYLYSITGIFPWPEEGTIAAAQEARANELLAVLTTERAYATIGRDRIPIQINFEEEDDEQEPIFTIEIQFQVTVYDSQSTN